MFKVIKKVVSVVISLSVIVTMACSVSAVTADYSNSYDDYYPPTGGKRYYYNGVGGNVIASNYYFVWGRPSLYSSKYVFCDITLSTNSTNKSATMYFKSSVSNRTSSDYSSYMINIFNMSEKVISVVDSKKTSTDAHVFFDTCKYTGTDSLYYSQAGVVFRSSSDGMWDGGAYKTFTPYN